MRVISKKPLREFWHKHTAAEGPLVAWYSNVKHSTWKMFSDVKKDYRSVDLVGRYLVFNIGGNKYRLIAVVHYKGARVYVRAVLTHDEYDRDAWKA